MRFRLYVLFLVCFAMGLLFLCQPALGSPPVKEVRIADSNGDWGYPTPYRHYPRGPGYVRMSWVFDTLVWKDRNDYIPALGAEMVLRCRVHGLYLSSRPQGALA